MMAVVPFSEASTMLSSSFEPVESHVPGFGVAADLAPPVSAIAGVDGQGSRPVARLRSERGYEFDFVENEITLITDDPAELAELQSRWPSSVLFDVPLGDPSDASGATRLYLLSIDASGADVSSIGEDLAGLGQNLFGAHEVSSEAALELLAVVAGERRRYGLRVGLNAIVPPSAIDRRQSLEAGIGVELTDSVGSLAFTYAPDAFTWPYAKREAASPSGYDRPLDTGAADAVRAVLRAGGLGNRVPVTIFDAGFYPNEDFPPYSLIGPAREDNPWPCSGADAPPAPGTICAAHGTHVVLSGFARANNDFATFAPGGEVADLQLVQSPARDVGSIVRYIRDAIGAVVSDPPRIVNISASSAVPAGLCFAVCEPLDELIKVLRDNGIVVVASAGNADIDVDATDEFIGVVFEEAAIIPCELDEVLCVGATTAFQTIRAEEYSNFGTAGGDGNSVDLFAPGDVYSVDAEAADVINGVGAVGDLQNVIRGTSFAAPFTAGTLALTMAANPSLPADAAVGCLLGTAFRPFPGGEFRSINALGAVSCALGNTHPFVEITTPSERETFFRGTEDLLVTAFADDYEDGSALPVDWTSSLDGFLGSGIAGETLGIYASPDLTAGEHDLCVEATDAGGRSDSDCVTVRILNVNPEATIQQPNNFATFFQSDEINLAVDFVDPDGSGSPTIEWWVYSVDIPVDSRPDTPTATGPAPSVSASGYAPGDYLVDVRVEDSDGGFDTDYVRITIDEDPENLPPTVTITSPEPGATESGAPDDPATFLVEATAEDHEDGPIPFEQIEWWISKAGGLFEPVELRPLTLCLTICITSYFLDVTPLPGVTETEITIQGRVEDSEGEPNRARNTEVTVVVTQLI